VRMSMHLHFLKLRLKLTFWYSVSDSQEVHCRSWAA
jgi:hypothetical protein